MSDESAFVDKLREHSWEECVHHFEQRTAMAQDELEQCQSNDSDELDYRQKIVDCCQGMLDMIPLLQREEEFAHLGKIALYDQLRFGIKGKLWWPLAIDCLPPNNYWISYNDNHTPVDNQQQAINLLKQYVRQLQSE